MVGCHSVPPTRYASEFRRLSPSLAQLSRERTPNSNELIGIAGVLGDLTIWELNPVVVGHSLGPGTPHHTYLSSI